MYRYFSLILGFILGIRGGYITLWTAGNPEPEEIFPYSVTSLPPLDQQALLHGIYIETDDELNARLEDYLS